MGGDTIVPAGSQRVALLALFVRAELSLRDVHCEPHDWAREVQRLGGDTLNKWQWTATLSNHRDVGTNQN